MNLTQEYQSIPYSKVLSFFGFKQAMKSKKYNTYIDGFNTFIIYRESEIKFNCLNIKTFHTLSIYQLIIHLKPFTTIKEHSSIQADLKAHTAHYNDLNISEPTDLLRILKSILKFKSFKSIKPDYLTEQQKQILNSDIFENKIFSSNNQISFPLSSSNSLRNLYHTAITHNTYHNNSFDCHWISNNTNAAKSLIVSSDAISILKFLQDDKIPNEYRILIIPPFANQSYINQTSDFLSNSGAQKIEIFSGPASNNFMLAFKFLSNLITKQHPEIHISINSNIYTEINIYSSKKGFNMTYMKLATTLNNSIRTELKIQPDQKFEENTEFTKHYMFEQVPNNSNKHIKTLRFHNNSMTNRILFNTILSTFPVDLPFTLTQK